MSRFSSVLSFALLAALPALSAEAWEFRQNDTHFFELDHAAPAAFRKLESPEKVLGQVILNFVCDTSLPATEYLVNVYMTHPDFVSWIADGNQAASLTLYLNSERRDAAPFSADPAYGDAAARLDARDKGAASVRLQFSQLFEGGVVQYQTVPGRIEFRDAVIAGTAPDADVKQSMAEAALLFSTISGARESIIGLFESDQVDTFAFGIDANGRSEATDAFWKACSRNGTATMVEMH